MDVQGEYDPVDAGGFIRIHAIRLREFYRANHREYILSFGFPGFIQTFYLNIQ